MTFRRILELKKLENIRIVYRYDIEDLSDEIMEKVINMILSEPNVDNVAEQALSVAADEQVFAIEFLPGQYDQQGDSRSC